MVPFEIVIVFIMTRVFSNNRHSFSYSIRKLYYFSGIVPFSKRRLRVYVTGVTSTLAAGHKQS